MKAAIKNRCLLYQSTAFIFIPVFAAFSVLLCEYCSDEWLYIENIQFFMEFTLYIHPGTLSTTSCHSFSIVYDFSLTFVRFLPYVLFSITEISLSLNFLPVLFYSRVFLNIAATFRPRFLLSYISNYFKPK